MKEPINKYQYKHQTANFKLLLEIFLTFFKISPFTFGGGFAMIPIFEKEMVEKKKWIDSENIIDIFTVAQSVPGAIAVNSATFIGYHLAGIPGALAAVLGIVTPTFAIIVGLALLLTSFQNNPYVQAALKGIRPTVVALIAIAAYRMGKTSIKDKTSWVICIAAGCILFIFKSINIIFLILSAALIGIAIFKIRQWVKKVKEHFHDRVKKDIGNVKSNTHINIHKKSQTIGDGKT